MLSHFFIKRPIFACVVSIVVFLLGLVSYPNLPVAQFPDIVPPTVSVTASYPGASAEDVVNTVAIPIEQQVNGVDNMIYMSSSSTSDGAYTLTVTFEVGTDPDMATVLVQNRVNIALSQLPTEVTRQGLTVKKKSPNIVAVLSIFDADQKDASGKIVKAKTTAELSAEQLAARNLYLANYTSRNIKDVLTRVHGVGEATIANSMDFSMRIWLDPNRMAALNLSAQEVEQAIQEQNVQVASGRLGQPPVPLGQQTNTVLTTLGRLTDVEQFENMVLRIGDDYDAAVLKLKDVATIELGAVTYQASSTFNHKPSCTICIYQLPDANSLDVAKGVEKAMEEMKPDFERDSVDYAVGYDATRFVEVSIEEVKETLYIALVLVIFVVYIFLQDWRAALIPTLTIPVSLVGTFFMMHCLGFTINSLTLFGLILVIGIVVDDAIVVVENTQRLIDEEKKTPVDAAMESMLQVSGPIFATTLVLMSVFIPTAMIGGIVGQLYQQFALTIAGAVLISAMCALTFAPALASLLLRPSIAPEKKFVGFRIFNFCFDTFAAAYLWTVKKIISDRVFVLVFWGCVVGGLYYGFTHLPTGFIPEEDQGVFFGDVRMPEGASQERTQVVLDKIQKMLDEDMAGIENTIVINGMSMLDGTMASNVASVILVLKPWGERSKSRGTDADSLYPKLAGKLAQIPDANVLLFSPPPISGLGNANGLQLQILDKKGVPSQELYTVAKDFDEAALNRGLVSFASSTFNPNAPRVRLDIDREKVKKMGISLSEVFGALQAYFGSMYVNDFNVFDRVYHVTVQASGDHRREAEDVLNLQIKNNDGQMLPIRSIAEVRDMVGPQVLSRYNLYPTAAINAMIPPGKSSGQTITALENLTKDTEIFPEEMGYDWTGMTYQEKHAGSSTMQVFALSIVFAFLVLAAQYESWSTPVIIMMAVPLGVGGAFLAVALRGLDVNIYTQIGLILMVGLSAKNAILITEFAVEKRREGEPIVQSAYEAGRLRLRPIMMTSFAFILGIFPLVVASGAGAASRHAIGTAVFGGMLTETMVGVFVTPVLFVILQTTAESIGTVINRFLNQGRESAQISN